jgi:ATP-dependent protease ClpP protease subunit
MTPGMMKILKGVAVSIGAAIQALKGTDGVRIITAASLIIIDNDSSAR